MASTAAARVVDLELRTGQVFEAIISGGEVQRYRAPLERGQFLEVIVEQRGIDVEVGLIHPTGREIVQVDSPTDDLGEEHLLTLAPSSDDFILEVKAFGGQEEIGSYELATKALRPSTTLDRARAQAAAAFDRAERLRQAGSHEQALGELDDALVLWQEIGDPFWLAQVHDRLGRSHAASKNWSGAIEAHAIAERLYGAAADSLRRGISLNQLGSVYYARQQMERALLSYEAALPFHRSSGNRRGEAIALRALAQSHRILGEVERSLGLYTQALEIWNVLGDTAGQAKIAHNMGVLHLSLGRLDRALDLLAQAEAAYRRLKRTTDLATTLDQLGRALLRLDRSVDAKHKLDEALRLQTQLEDLRGRVTTLVLLASIRRDLGDFDGAGELLGEALRLAREVGDAHAEAHVLHHTGLTHLAAGRPREADAACASAHSIFERRNLRQGAAAVALCRSRSDRARGALEGAIRGARQAVEIIESLRVAVSPDLRSDYFSTVQNAYDLLIGLLMEQHRRQPSASFDVQAFQTSEAARARSLLDLLGSARERRDPGLDSERTQLEKSLQARVNALERDRMEAERVGGLNARSAPALEREMRLLVEQLGRVRGQARVSALAPPQPLGLTEIQQRILDPTTLVLEYHLVEPTSFLWVVGPKSFASFELPSREQVETLALEAHRAVRRGVRREGRDRSQALLADLGEMLLPPTLEIPEGQHLLIVPDGALQYLPFAALVKPDAGGRSGDSRVPLVADHKITVLPSLSVIPHLGRPRFARESAQGQLAVVANPVFSTQSSGPAENVESASAAAFATRNSTPFARLPFSGAEGRAILSQVDPNRRFGAIGFAATKELVLSGVLADYAIVHFATHSILNAAHPELSGLVLSLVDADGNPRDGFLRAHEIRNLELSAELVVLSACRTALGKSVRGEGLLSLGQGFLQAGAKSALVSLWNVEDQATAELMRAFYHYLLTEGSGPAAALRRAQLELRSNPARAASYNWAGFVLLGHWRSPATTQPSG